jgi:hypothetical protein
MSREIWKFQMHHYSRPTFQLPLGSQFLSVQNQGEKLVLWFLVNPSNPKEDRAFYVYMTGETIPTNPGTYLGTVQFDNGSFVFHVFEVDSQLS